MINSFDKQIILSEGLKEDDYPIIFYQSNLDSNLLPPLNNESLYSFSDLQDALEKGQSLKASFLLIVPNNTKEEELLQRSQALENTYARKLASFEEESIFNEHLPVPTMLSHTIYVFHTRQDFEEEILVSEEIEKMMAANGITEVAKDFREEFLLWELLKDKQGGIYEGLEGSKLKSLKGISDFFTPQELTGCKEYCIRALKELSRKRKREKLKMIYYVNLGDSCGELEEHLTALESYEKALAIIKPIYGESHLSTASLYMKLAGVHMRSKEFQKALELLAKALEIRMSIFGELHPKTAGAYFGLGRVYRVVGEYQRASEFHLKALEVRKSIFGAFHVEVSNSYCELALLANSMKEPQKAIEYYILALDIEKSVNGETHPSIAILYNNLASALDRLGEKQKALEFSYKALEIRERLFGEKHPSVLTSYTNLVAGYFNIREFQKALECCSKALDITKSLYGEIHPKTEAIYKKFVQVLRAQGEDEQALKYQEKALYVKVSLQGEINPEIAGLYADLAQRYRVLRNYQKALEFQLKSANIQRAINGEDHPQTEAACHRLAEIYEEIKESQQQGIQYDLTSVDVSQFVTEEKSKEAMEVEK